MVPSLRQFISPWALLALAGTALMAWLGLQGFVFSDYDREAAPAYLALAHGDVGGFLSLSPSYGGSLIMRAPFALLPDLWGGGELAVFRAAARAVPAGRRRARARARRPACSPAGSGAAPARWCCCCAPPTRSRWRALEIGHPEELLGGALCVGAVLAAVARKPALAGLLLGLAIANKAWARARDRAGPDRPARAGAGARWRSPAALAVAFTLPLLLAAPATATPPRRQPPAGAIFQPWQVWWFLGDMDLTAAPAGAGSRAPRRRGCRRSAPADRLSSRCRCRCSPGAGRPTRSRCSRCCCCCAASSTRGTTPTTCCRACSRSPRGSRCATAARRCSRSPRWSDLHLDGADLRPRAVRPDGGVVYLALEPAARRLPGLADLRAGAARGARRSARGGRASVWSTTQ